MAGLLITGCTAADEPDADATTAAPTTGVSLPAETDTGTGGPTTTEETVIPTVTPTGDDGTTGGATTAGEAAMTECESAVAEAGGLSDLSSADAQAREVFESCGSIEEFTAAVESQLEGFEDVDLEPYIRTGCAFAEDLSGTPLCESV